MREEPRPLFTISRPGTWRVEAQPLACSTNELAAMDVVGALLLQGERSVQVHRQGSRSRELVMELGVRGIA